ncbi:hypothetical protein DFH08DRAFT_873413 [Mycena albidolilacea]|uniref:ABM domain-containing protein n=1 Tax=Mycena albidolilacea TaxID=1033008 RepID=A0AAD6ZX11_9AGAR|nr:hypothetical protein DFH08DRAFT_873413 [Mycena albidolilacea]
MPILQITSFPASDAFIATPDIFKAPIDVIKSAEGYKSSFYGLQIEDKKTGYFISVWESYELRQKFLADPRAAGLVEKLKPAVAGKLERHHIDVSGDPTAAFSSPVVSITVLTLKSDAAPEKLAALLEELEKGARTTAGARAIMWGQSLEDKNNFLLIGGWDSLEAHQEAIKGGAQLATTSQVRALVDASVGHSALKKHE